LSGRSRLALLAAGWLAAAATGRASETPGQPQPLYQLPAAGSYALPPIDRVSEHVLLGSDGREAPLLGLGSGRFSIVASSTASKLPSSLRKIPQSLEVRAVEVKA